MSILWETNPLTDYLDLITYGFTNPMPTTTVGPFLVTAKDIQGGTINFDTARHTSLEAYSQKLTDKSRPRVGDVLLTKDGSIGRVAVCTRNDICINQSVALLRPNSRILPSFLAYLLQAPEYQRRMESDSDGSTIKHIYITRVDKMPISVPSFEMQQAIVDVLSAFDEKIAANNKLIALTDSLARTQFHAALHDSQLQPLSSLAEFVNGKAFTKGASGSGRVVVRIAELNSGIGNSTVFSDAVVDDKHVVRPGDTLFAWSGSLTLHRWFRDEAIVNQHIFKVIPLEGTPDWLIYELIRNKLGDFKMIAANKATTMGHIQRKHLDEPVLVPTEATQREIAPVMESLWRTALNTGRQNLTLAATREVLLPQLISGKVRVQEAAQIVAAAV